MPNLTAPANPNRSIHTYLDQIEREHFYGTVTVRYENGIAVHVRREESILPVNIMEKPYDESRNSRRQ